MSSKDSKSDIEQLINQTIAEKGTPTEDEQPQQTAGRDQTFHINAQTVFLGGTNSNTVHQTNNAPKYSHPAKNVDPITGFELGDVPAPGERATRPYRVPEDQINPEDRKAIEDGLWDGIERRIQDENTKVYKAALRKQAKRKKDSQQFWTRNIMIILVIGCLAFSYIIAIIKATS